MIQKLAKQYFAWPKLCGIDEEFSQHVVSEGFSLTYRDSVMNRINDRRRSFYQSEIGLAISFGIMHH